MDNNQPVLQPDPSVVVSLPANTRKHYCHGTEASPHGKYPLLLNRHRIGLSFIYMRQCPRCLTIYKSKVILGPNAPEGDNDWEGTDFKIEATPGGAG